VRVVGGANHVDFRLDGPLDVGKRRREALYETGIDRAAVEMQIDAIVWGVRRRVLLQPGVELS
jgi:hypothetical protein